MATTATATTTRIGTMEPTKPAPAAGPCAPPAKTPSRPALLTLTGLYRSSKSVYVSYMPEAASKTVESLAEKLLAVSSPYVASLHKALPAGAEDKDGMEKKDVDAADDEAPSTELNLTKLDNLVASLCSQADARVDGLIASATARLSSAKSSVESRTQAVVHSTLGSERVVALQERCVDAYEDLTDRASTYYSTAQEYTPAARHVAVRYTQIVQREVKSKGLVGTAKAALGWARDQAATALSTLRREGLVAGTKSIATSIWQGITSTLHRARLEAVTPVLDEDASAARTADPTPTFGGAGADVQDHVEDEEEDDDDEEEDDE